MQARPDHENRRFWSSVNVAKLGEAVRQPHVDGKCGKVFEGTKESSTQAYTVASPNGGDLEASKVHTVL